MTFNLFRIFVLCSALVIPLLGNAENKTDTIQLKFETNLGDFIVELYPNKAPQTVNNFLSYVDDGFYDGTIFHRVIKKFMIQGGGMTTDFSEKKTKAPIPNESDNGLKNTKGALSMARTQAVDSATAQFFINTNDNAFLDHQYGKHGYAVFGKVIDGYDVIDGIESQPTGDRRGYQDVPVKEVIIIELDRL